MNPSPVALPAAMDWGSAITLWTVRLSLACYALVVAGALLPGVSVGWRRAGRGLWTAGCVLFWAHVAAAFHYYHGWSHSHAVAHTAAETKRLMGWEFGNGIWMSYLFLLLWTWDAARQWQTPLDSQRPGWSRIALHVYLFFIAFNGAIIFEDGPVRQAGILCCVTLAVLALARLALPWRNLSLST